MEKVISHYCCCRSSYYSSCLSRKEHDIMRVSRLTICRAEVSMVFDQAPIDYFDW